jgi:hypothetical protein
MRLFQEFHPIGSAMRIGIEQPQRGLRQDRSRSASDTYNNRLQRAKVIVLEPGHSQAFATQRADRKGNFQFPDLPPGKYTITVSTKGHRALEGETFWVTRGTLTKIALTTARNDKVFICQ